MSWLMYFGILVILVTADRGDAFRLRSKYVCQDSTLRIQCMGNGEKIVVKNAMFGRRTYGKCWKAHAFHWNVHCEAPKSTSIVKAVCDGRKSCLLQASHYVFEGDPCSGTEKYLAVKYICKDPKYAVYTATACQYRYASLLCRRNTKIRVLYALYGRLDRKTCPNLLSFYFSTNCKTRGSLKKVRKHCDGKKRCVVYAANSVFGHHTCPGTKKYLKIKYLCVV